MKTKAAIAWKSASPLTIEEVYLQGPQVGVVLGSTSYSRWLVEGILAITTGLDRAR